MNEPTCENVIHEIEVTVNDLGYQNKLDDNNMLNYPGESDTCSEVQILEEIVDIIGKNNVIDEFQDVTIPLESVTRKKTLIMFKTLHKFMVQFEKTTPELVHAIRKIRDALQL